MSIHLRAKCEVWHEGVLEEAFETAYCAGYREVGWPIGKPDEVTCKRCLAALNRMAKEQA